MNAAERKKLYEMPQEGEMNLPFPSCGCTDAEVLSWKKDELALRPMQVAPREDMVAERINPWTRDMHPPGEGTCGPQMVNLASCGAVKPSATRAPKDYMADMPDDGAIILNSRGQCVLKIGEGTGKVDKNSDYRSGGTALEAPPHDLVGEARQIK